jgi:hypothetical protein
MLRIDLFGQLDLIVSILTWFFLNLNRIKFQINVRLKLNLITLIKTTL